MLLLKESRACLSKWHMTTEQATFDELPLNLLAHPFNNLPSTSYLSALKERQKL